VEGTGTHFHVQGLENHAAMLRPEILQSQDQALKGPDIRSCLLLCLVCHDGCLLISLCVAPRLSFGALRKKERRIIRVLAVYF
jgi:hypothetical protein